MSQPVIRTRDLYRIYHSAGADVQAVAGVTLDIFRGQLTAIVGRSGAGKTTLLNLMSGLDLPSSGAVWIGQHNLSDLSEAQRLELRRKYIGFVFQNFGLLPLLTARENIGVPLRMRGKSRSEREQRIDEALEWVGLSGRAGHRPYELSGGEQQRVAVARALAARPKIILADEPTGQLDTQTGRQVLGIMRDLVRELDLTMVIVTHDDTVMSSADVIHEMRDGRLLETRVAVQ